MALRSACLATLLAGGAVAQQDSTFLLQSSASPAGEQMLSMLSVEMSVEMGSNLEGSFGHLPENAPTWCKEDVQLTWRERMERMQQHLTLEWSKKMVKQMLEQNETIPEWMDKIVSEDEKRGKTKWAAQESKRLKAEGKETPKWMDELVEEGAKWSNRWAACKAAELKDLNEEVPQWMVENARKGIMEAATEKAAELQEQIDEMEEEKDEETELVDAHGDVQEANKRMLARKRESSARSVSSQYRVLEGALEELEQAEAEAASAGGNPTRRLKQAIRRAKSAVELLNKLLDRKGHMLSAQMSAAH